ncbi:2-hydroxyacid dehydrogenase [Jiulongibacter sp. NS-SX5]|uniref:2-hydroxyacid dehydrogenase n=1 Tax=Jiulongibacter sp. NS-SX5 TaxID=3463854 RepID=UPI0040597424
MKVCVFSTKPYDKEYFEKNLHSYELEFTYYESPLNISTVQLSKGFDAVCVFVNDKLDNQVIRKLSENGIKLIALRCAGFNNVDIKAAQQAGINIVRVPAYSPEAVAEHAVALILTLNRKTHKAYNRVREGNFALNNLMGFNLYGKTVGVIGTGKIGQAFSRIMLGFGCKVMAYDINSNDELLALGVEYVSQDELFQKSDIISLHCPLIPETQYIINKDSLAKMKEHVMIINTSRGALVNTKDVIEALKKKKVGHLGIDVYEQEENLFFNDLSELIIEDDMLLRLNSFPNVLITSHQAFFTKEAMDEITLTTLNNIKAFKNGKAMLNEVK